MRTLSPHQKRGGERIPQKGFPVSTKNVETNSPPVRKEVSTPAKFRVFEQAKASKKDTNFKRSPRKENWECSNTLLARKSCPAPCCYSLLLYWSRDAPVVLSSKATPTAFSLFLAPQSALALLLCILLWMLPAYLLGSLPRRLQCTQLHNILDAPVDPATQYGLRPPARLGASTK